MYLFTYQCLFLFLLYFLCFILLLLFELFFLVSLEVKTFVFFAGHHNMIIISYES